MTDIAMYQRAVRIADTEGGLSRSDFADGIISTMGLETIINGVYVDKTGGKWEYHRDTKKYRFYLDKLEGYDY